MLTHQPYVSLATGSTAIIFAILTIAALRFGRSPCEFRIAPLWCAVLLLAGLLAGKTGLGLVLSVSVVVSNLLQLWVAYREANLADLSLVTWLLSITDGLVWGIYALLRQDVAIMAYGLFQFATSTAIVALKMARRRRGYAVDKVMLTDKSL